MIKIMLIVQVSLLIKYVITLYLIKEFVYGIVVTINVN